MQNYLIVGLGGFLGAIARFWVAEYVAQRMGTRFPYGTFLINCSGSFAIGVVVTMLDHYTHWTPSWRCLLPIGFIGAYTTFSTFELETLQSMQQGHFGLALANVALSVVLGFACVFAGVMTGKSVVRITTVSVRSEEDCAEALLRRAPNLDTSEAGVVSAD